MKLRNKILGTMFAFATAASMPTFASAQTSLRLADNLPLTHVFSKLTSQRFIAAVEERSEGRITFQHFPAQQIAKADGMLDAVQTGIADIGLVGLSFFTDKVPLSSVVELPGLFTSTEVGNRAYAALVASDLNEQEFNSIGVTMLWPLATPVQQLIFRDKTSYDGMSDLQGTKIRVPGASGELIAHAMGAVGVKISTADLFTALQLGTVDSAIQNAPTVLSRKFNEVTVGITTNMPLGVSAWGLVMNKKVFDGLSEEDQKVLLDVSAELIEWGAATFEKVDVGSFKKLDADPTTALVTLDPAQLVEVTDALSFVVDQWETQVSSRGLPASEILSTFRGHIADAEAN